MPAGYEGVRVGLRDVHYALLTSDVYGTGANYAAPVRIVGAISANINPNASRETLFADDGPMEVATSLGEIELELGVADLPLGVQAALLGLNFNVATGRMSHSSEAIPPWLALGFRALKSNGAYRYVWLLKGKFMLPEDAHETKGDTISFQTPTISGAFVRRDFDDLYRLTGDTDETAFDPTAPAWFSAATLDVP